jgi:hypothetical protein
MGSATGTRNDDAQATRCCRTSVFHQSMWRAVRGHNINLIRDAQVRELIGRSFHH